VASVQAKVEAQLKDKKLQKDILTAAVADVEGMMFRLALARICA
jgi:hypothetical protein